MFHERQSYTDTARAKGDAYVHSVPETLSHKGHGGDKSSPLIVSPGIWQ